MLAERHAGAEAAAAGHLVDGEIGGLQQLVSPLSSQAWARTKAPLQIEATGLPAAAFRKAFSVAGSASCRLAAEGTITLSADASA